MAKRKPRIGWGSLYEGNGQISGEGAGCCTIAWRDRMHAAHHEEASAALLDSVLIYLRDRAA